MLLSVYADNGWLFSFGTAPELNTAPVLPDAATLDDIAQKWDGTLPEEDEEALELRSKCGEVKPGQRTDDVAAKAAGFGGRDEYRRAN